MNINIDRVDIKDLRLCERCGEDCVKSPINNAYPPRYCQGCYHELVAALTLARRVADAAAAVEIANHAVLHITELPDYKQRWDEYQIAIGKLVLAEADACDALSKAVGEYRKLMEGENGERRY